MGRISLVATIGFEAESKEAILRALIDHRARCLRDEPGTLQFEVMVPSEDPCKLVLFELYEDAAALAAHAQGESIGQYRKEVAGKITTSLKYTCTMGAESVPR
ncbi:putative quinol monooxygenase [Geothrix sp. PMB-07]|uniref:putative quinol monooxygenase n=1 Tax=Geothrix sp. PMB-07 TaxID=3068640 RepID=UPI0027407C3A|nr:antibiotic biosynthesis monooxygenase family protein [Geothrix sp. PMB-07]WLT32125.1 antibiotic biosynthesis monooxygenase family protein [Geothrix sp. PMB-07]